MATSYAASSDRLLGAGPNATSSLNGGPCTIGSWFLGVVGAPHVFAHCSPMVSSRENGKRGQQRFPISISRDIIAP